MGYKYGHPSTAWDGIKQWLVGFSSKSGARYIIKTDFYQEDSLAIDMVIAYFASKGETIKKKKWKYNRYKYSLKIQKDFKDFTTFVKENYEQVHKTK